MSKPLYIISFGLGVLILGGVFLYYLLPRPNFNTLNSNLSSGSILSPEFQANPIANENTVAPVISSNSSSNNIITVPVTNPAKVEATTVPAKTVPTASDKVVLPIIPAASTGNTEIMAWIYPGGQSCNAKTEYSDGRKIAVLKAEYFSLSESGDLVQINDSKGNCNGYSAANIASLKKYSKEQYVTVSSSYAGSMDLFLSAALQDNTDINTLVDFTVKNNITGIELDFEDFGGWTQPMYEHYKEFVTKLGNALHEKKKKLMIDGPATSNSVEEAWYVWRYADFKTLPIDKVVIMAYDYQYDQGSGQPIAPISWIQGTIKWTLGRFPDKAKLSVGIPSYGYKGTIGTQKFSLLTYDQIKKEAGFSSAQRDPNSFEMSWQNGNNVYFYQDGISMTKKLQAIKSAGINSVSVWHLGGNLWFK